MPRAPVVALSEANSSDMAIKMSGALTTNSHSNELKCMLVERILEKTAQHGFISMSRGPRRGARIVGVRAPYKWVSRGCSLRTVGGAGGPLAMGTVEERPP